MTRTANAAGPTATRTRAAATIHEVARVEDDGLSVGDSPMGSPPNADQADHAETKSSVLAGLFGDAAVGVSPDELIAGRFAIERRIGAGAMGEVLLAHDRELDRRVALKRLLGPGRGDPTRQRRIAGEARALAKIHHPNVVTVFDVLTIDETVLVAMEYVRGQSLAAWLGAPRQAADIATVLRGAAEGLAVIHDAGLVHRDIKPDNILVGADGRVRVADLGLARDGDPSLADSSPQDSTPVNSEAALTRTGALVGTPLYMAPEVLMGAAADARSDQFSFGVMLHEAVTGVRPFAGASASELAESIIAGRRVAQQAGPRPPSRVQSVIEQTLQLDRAKRFASMHAVADALGPRSRRGVRFGLAAVAIAAVGVGVGALVDAPSARKDPCPPPDEAKTEIWSSEIEASLRNHLQAAVEPLDVDPILGATTARLSARADVFSDEHQRLCRATFVERVQTEATFAAQTSCLEQQRHTVRALLSRTAAMDRAELARLPRALSRIPPASACTSSKLEPSPEVTAVQTVLANAEAERYLADYAAAGKTLDRAEELLSESGNPDDSLRARLAFERGKIAVGLGTAEAAVDHYLRAVELAESSRDDRLAAITWINLVATQAGDERDPKQAAFYLSRARAAVARHGHPPLLAASLLHRSAQQKMMAGDHADAAEELNRALALYREADADVLAITPVVTDLGRAHYQRGAYADAVEAFELVAENYESEFGPHHPRLASGLYNLGSALILADRLEDAQPKLERALAIRRERLGDAHPKVGQTLNSLAGVHLQRGELAVALGIYEEALRVQSAALGPRHPMLAATKTNIGRTLSQLARHEEAVAMLGNALEMVSKEKPPMHPDVADALHARGSAQLRAEQFGEAITDFERATAIRTKVFGADASKTAETGVSLAEALARAGRRTEADLAYTRWVQVLRDELGEDHASVNQAITSRDTYGGRP